MINSPIANGSSPQTAKDWPGTTMSLMPSTRGFTLVELLVVIAIIALLVALLLPAVQGAREAARRIHCSNNLKQIGVAIAGYMSRDEQLPAAVTRWRNIGGEDSAAGGSGATSNQATWIATILPFLEQRNLYDLIDFSVPCNPAASRPPVYASGNNDTVLNTRLDVVRCASDSAAKPNASMEPTNYVVNSGTQRSSLPVMTGVAYMPTPGNNNLEAPFNIAVLVRATGDMIGVKPVARIRDGLSNTIFVSECVIGSPTLYAGGNAGSFSQCSQGLLPPSATPDPNVVRGDSWFFGNYNSAWSFNTAVGPNDMLFSRQGMDCMGYTYIGVLPARSRHPGGVNVTTGDGGVHFVSDSIDITVWQAYGTIAGGETAGSITN